VYLLYLLHGVAIGIEGLLVRSQVLVAIHSLGIFGLHDSPLFFHSGLVFWFRQADLLGQQADLLGQQADLSGQQADLSGQQADLSGQQADLSGQLAYLSSYLSLPPLKMLFLFAVIWLVSN
jgi:hypothetical protein